MHQSRANQIRSEQSAIGRLEKNRDDRRSASQGRLKQRLGRQHMNNIGNNAEEKGWADERADGDRSDQSRR